MTRHHDAADEEAIRLFGAAVRSARLGRQMTQRQLAGMVSVHRTTIAITESGKNAPRIALVLRLVGELDIDLGALAVVLGRS